MAKIIINTTFAEYVEKYWEEISMAEKSLWSAIKRILDGNDTTNEEKLERIKTYIEIHEINNKPSMNDMA